MWMLKGGGEWGAPDVDVERRSIMGALFRIPDSHTDNVHGRAGSSLKLSPRLES